MKVIAPKLREDFISKINIDDFIEYELENHECYLTCDFTQVVNIIYSYYDMPIDDVYNKVKSVYQNNLNNMDSFDDSHIGI